MPFRFSTHALEQMQANQIPRVMVEWILQNPDQKTRERDDITCFQQRIREPISEKEY
jgi:hypothetical protein